MNLAAIGSEIRNARKSQKLTQAALAAQLRMGRSTLSQLETGVIGELGVRKLAQVCDRLGLELTVRPRGVALTLHEAYSLKKRERDASFKEADAVIHGTATRKQHD